jgi:rod shape-determining protein MreD
LSRWARRRYFIGAAVIRARGISWLFWGSIGICYLLQLTPLPAVLLALKPFWLALVLIYWALELPERMPLGLAFVLGLGGDLVTGELFGEQALRLCILCFIALRFRSRLRFFPMWQQTLAVFALLLNDRVVYLMVHAFAGDPPPAADFWLAPLAGMLVWPWLFLLLDDARARLRVHES